MLQVLEHAQQMKTVVLKHRGSAPYGGRDGEVQYAMNISVRLGDHIGIGSVLDGTVSFVLRTLDRSHNQKGPGH